MNHQKQHTAGQNNGPRFDEDDEDLMFRIMHGSCQGFSGCNSCALEQQLDLFAVRVECRNHGFYFYIVLAFLYMYLHFYFAQHCRQPMSFLSLFGTSDQPMTSLPPGAYSMPNHCEYCSQRPCAPNCRRPTFYFQKKRPPFDNNNENWEENGHPKVPQQRPSSPASSLFSGLFGRSPTER